MNPILASAIYGSVKGLVIKPARRPHALFDATSHLVAPVREELLYRAGLSKMGVSPWLGAALFATHHVLGEKHTTGTALLRFADTMFGAFLYQRAYKKMGLAGAVAAHSLHNLGVSSGQHVLRRRR